MIAILILALSSLFQFLTAFVALWNIKITGKKKSWILIASATILMGIRRIIPLYHILKDPRYVFDTPNEIIGLILSLAFFLGVIGIRHIFVDCNIYADKIARLYNEKKILLKEVHHRIKNNMTVIKSLLSMKSQSLNIPEAVKVFQDAIARIESMGVLYDKLYKTEEYQNVSIQKYIYQLTDEIYKIFPDRENIKIEKEIEDFTIETEVIFPLGIIVNELLTNSMKYAFADRENGRIKISATVKDKNVTLIFEDNGIGIPDFKDNDKKKGFGFALIDLLTEQIGGTYKIENNDGTKFIFEFTI